MDQRLANTPGSAFRSDCDGRKYDLHFALVRLARTQRTRSGRLVLS